MERKHLGIADGLQWKADQRFKRATGPTVLSPTDRVHPARHRMRARTSPQDAELKSSPPDAELESVHQRATKCRASAQCSIRFQWTDRVERKHLGIADGLRVESRSAVQRRTGHHCSWHSHRAKSTQRDTGCRARVSPQNAELKSSPPDAELVDRPSAPRNVAPLPSAQSGSNGLIEWSANSSKLQTGSSISSVAPSPSARSGSERVDRRVGAQADRLHRQAPALTRAGKPFNGQHANVGSASHPVWKADRTQPLGRTA